MRSRRERSNRSRSERRWSQPIVHSRTKYWVQHRHYNSGSAQASDSEARLAAARERQEQKARLDAPSPRGESATVEGACALATRCEAARSSLMSLNARNDSSPPYTAADEEVAKPSF